MLDLLADASVGAAELEQALAMYAEADQQEALAARFENLEARLSARIERGLAEIEGRLSQRSGDPSPPKRKLPPPPPKPRPAPTPVKPEVPEEANLAFLIDGELVWGPSGTEFYQAAWRWLLDHGHYSKNDLPIRSGKKRWMLAAEPVHPNGNAFVIAKELAPGVWLETNLSRSNIVGRVAKLLRLHDVPYEVVVGPESAQ